MKMQYLMAIDAGTTSVKTSLFDLTGHAVACRVCEYQLDKPSPDFVEVDPEVYWSAASDAIAAVLRDAAVSCYDVAAVGVTSQGETLIVLDKDGRPLRKAIVWLDNRAVAEAAEIASRFRREEVYRVTGQQEIVPTWTAAKILWLRHNEPEKFARAAKFLLVEDYLVYRLTGNFVTDHALCPSTLYYDLVNGGWWSEMLEFLEITPSQLPELKYSGEIAGTVVAGAGLSRHTVVTVAPIDQVAAAAGAGNIASGMVTETTGSAMAVCATLGTPAYDEKMQIGLYRHALPGAYVMMPWNPTAGMVLRWFRDELGAGEDYAGLSHLAEQVSPGSDGLILLPHLGGAFCPDAEPNARGVFYGISLAHRRGHFVRAIFESVAFLLRHNLDTLARAGLSCQSVCCLGGAARNPLWLQIKADVMNKPVTVPAGEEATCLGTAMLAGVGAGLFASLPEAVAQMVRIEKCFEPIHDNVAKYESVYHNYRQINQLLMPTFGGHHVR